MTVHAPEKQNGIDKYARHNRHNFMILASSDHEESFFRKVFFQPNNLVIFCSEHMRLDWALHRRKSLGLLELVKNVVDVMSPKINLILSCIQRVDCLVLGDMELRLDTLDFHRRKKVAILVHGPSPSLCRRKHAVVRRRDKETDTFAAGTRCVKQTNAQTVTCGALAEGPVFIVQSTFHMLDRTSRD